MSTCKHCGKPISPAGGPGGPCPHCGQPMVLASEERDIAKTIEIPTPHSPTVVEDGDDLVPPSAYDGSPKPSDRHTPTVIEHRPVQLRDDDVMPTHRKHAADSPAADQTIVEELGRVVPPRATPPANQTVVEEPGLALPPGAATVVESPNVPPSSGKAGPTIDSAVPDLPGQPGSSDHVAEGSAVTMDSSVEMGSGSESGGSRGSVDLTIDSSVVLPVDQGSGAAGSGPDVTIESVEPSASGLMKIWGRSAHTQAPQMTIRTEQEKEAAAQSMSTLTIHTRAVGTSRDIGVPELDYDLEKKIGQGGMGMVYSARQASLDRNVAVKMLRPEMMTSDGHRRKFISEAVVTGELEHPGIIPVYDMGCNADGNLFYSMKQVYGLPWSQVIRDKNLHENLEILMRVCDAVAFAHSRDVIHRDLKPENVMIGEFGEVLVLDWGLAATVGQPGKSVNITRVMTMGGTPAYMAPEMALGPLEAIGKHSDVYLLGAILYECITGKLPRHGRTSTACLMAAARNKIEPTDKQGELVEISLKAMSTRPEDRYGSVKELQAAIRDFQSHSESIALSQRAAQELETARQSNDYRDYAKALFGYEEAYDLWSHNQSARSGISAAKLAYATSALNKGDYDLGLSLLQRDDPDHATLYNQLLTAQQERDARAQRLQAARRVMLGLAALVFLAVSVGCVLVWREKQKAIASAIEAETQRGIAVVKAQEARDQRQVAEQKAIEAKDSAELADQRARDARASERRAVEESYVALIGLAAVKIEERAFDHAFDLLEQCPPHLRNWEWGRLKYLCDLRDGQPPIAVNQPLQGIAYHPSSTLLASVDELGRACVWNLDSPADDQPLAQLQLTAAGTALAFDPHESDWLAVGCRGADNLLLWNFRTGERHSLAGHTGDVTSIEFSPHQHDSLLTASKDKSARLWNVKTRQVVQTFLGHDSWVWQATFSPTDQNTIATASEDGTARIWDIHSGQQRLSDEGEPMPFRGHRSAVFTVQFSPDGRMVASGGFDQRVLLWDPNGVREFDFDALLRGEAIQEQPYVALAGHTASVSRVRFSRDGRLVVSGGHDNTIRIWSAQKQEIEGRPYSIGQQWKVLRGHSSLVRSLAFTPNKEHQIASASQDGNIRFWNVLQYEEEQFIPDLVLRGHKDAVFMADFAANSDLVVTASRDRTARAWNPQDAQAPTEFREGHLFLVSNAAYYPDGKRLLTAAGDGTVRVWDRQRVVEMFSLHRTGIMGSIALSRRGRWIVTGKEPDLDDNGRPEPNQQGVVAAIWDGDSGQLVRLLRGHAAPVTAIAISADEKTVFTGDAKGRCNLWDIETGKQRLLPAWHMDKITAACFVDQDRRLLTASRDTTVGQWDTQSDSPQPLDELTLDHQHGISSMAVTPDGTRVLTGDEEGMLQLWNRELHTRLWSWQVSGDSSEDAAEQFQQAAVTAVDISADGQFALAVAVSGGRQPTLRMWKLDGMPDDAVLVQDFPNRDVWAAVFAPDREEVLVLGGDEATALDYQANVLERFNPHRTVSFASYSPDATRVVTAGWDNTARIWDATTGQPLWKLDASQLDQEGESSASVRINSAVFSADGNWILTAGDNGMLILWDARTGQMIKPLQRQNGPIHYATFSRDAQQVLVACNDGSARILNVDSGQEQLSFSGHNGAVLHVAYSQDDSRIVTSGADGVAKVWDTQSGELIMGLYGHTDAVTCAVFSADMKRVLTGSRDQSAKLWDTSLRSTQDDAPAPEQVAGPDATEPLQMVSTASQTDADAVTNDSSAHTATSASVEPPAAASSPADSDAEQADPTTTEPVRGKEILTLRGHHSQAVTSVAFSRDGTKALTSSLDGTAVVWPAKPW